MATNRRKQTIFTEINITPLTDIFLVLLILLMVIAPMLDFRGINLNAPSLDTTGKTTTDPKAQILTVSEAGAITLNGNRLTFDSLMIQLRSAKANYPDGVIVKIAPRAQHGLLVKTLDAVKQAQLEKVAVVKLD